MKKAKMIAKYYDKYTTHIEYEYRGHKYEVEYANATSYCVTPAHIQHMIEQSRIDRMIEQGKKENKIEDNAEYGLEMFFNELM